MIQKTAEAKLADIIRKVLKTSQNNHSETKKEEILREIFMSLELRHKINDDLRSRKENFWLLKINIII